MSELAAIRLAGFEPAGLVMGTSITRLAVARATVIYGTAVTGWTRVERTYPCTHVSAHGTLASRTGYNVEHVGYRDGVLGARDRALGRLTAEAVAHEAHGVVGVRVFIRRTGDGGVLLEFSVVGTAIRRRGVEPLPRPFTSHLSGQEFVKLLGIGFVPMTMVFAIGVIECIPGCGTELAERAGWNVELTQVGEAASASRRLADEQMRYAARGADGVVGVEIRSTSRRRGPSHRRVYESIAIGTAARRFDPAAAGHVRPALTMVRLADRSTVDVGGAAAPRRS